MGRRTTVYVLVCAAVSVLGALVPSAVADADVGGVVVAPVDPSDLVNPPRVRIGVNTPGHSGSTASGHRGSQTAHVPVCTYAPAPQWESFLRGVAGSTPVPGLPGIGGSDGVDPEARLYSKSCDGVDSGFVWVNPGTPVPGRGAAPSPGVLAQSAYRELALGSPVIRMSPGSSVPQVVRVPTWLWLDSTAWGSRSATVSVPGLSVTATATPVRVRWDTGDGAWVTCTGPGTPFRPGVDDSGASSPDCGHTYTRAGNDIVVTAMVTWRVSWSGGGTSGVLAPLTSAAQVRVRVVEAQALNQ